MHSCTPSDDFRSQAKAFYRAAPPKMTEGDILAALTCDVAARGGEAATTDWVWLFTECMRGNTIDFIVQFLDEELLPIDQVRAIVVAFCDPLDATERKNVFTKELLDGTNPRSVQILQALFGPSDHTAYAGLISSIGARTSIHAPRDRATYDPSSP